MSALNSLREYFITHNLVDILEDAFMGIPELEPIIPGLRYTYLWVCVKLAQ